MGFMDFLKDFLGLGNEHFYVSRVSLSHSDPDLTGSLPGFQKFLNEKQILPRVGDAVSIPHEMECAFSTTEEEEIQGLIHDRLVTYRGVVDKDMVTRTRMVKVETTGIAKVSSVMFFPQGKRFASKGGHVVVHVQAEGCEIVEKYSH